MSDPNLADQELMLAQEELRLLLLPINGQDCFHATDSWELKHLQNPRIKSAVKEYASFTRMTLAKNTAGPMAIINGDNNNVQHGANFAQVGQNNQAGDVNVEIAPVGAVDQPAAAKLSWLAPVANLLVGIGAGAIAVWWLLPQAYAFGNGRWYVTVGTSVVVAVTVVLSWFQYRRQVWEKVSYISLGTILLLKSLMPPLILWTTGVLGNDIGRVKAYLNFYVGVSPDDYSAYLQPVVGFACLVLGFFTKTKS